MFPTCQGTACFLPEFLLSCKGLQSTCENAVLAIITGDCMYNRWKIQGVPKKVAKKMLLKPQCTSSITNSY